MNDYSKAQTGVIQFGHTVFNTIQKRLGDQKRLGSVAYITMEDPGLPESREVVCAIGAAVSVDQARKLERDYEDDIVSIRNCIRGSIQADNWTLTALRNEFDDVILAFLHDDWVALIPGGQAIQVTGPLRDELSGIWDQYLVDLQNLHDPLAVQSMRFIADDPDPSKWVTTFSEIARTVILPAFNDRVEAAFKKHEHDTRSKVIVSRKISD